MERKGETNPEMKERREEVEDWHSLVTYSAFSSPTEVGKQRVDFSAVVSPMGKSTWPGPLDWAWEGIGWGGFWDGGWFFIGC